MKKFISHIGIFLLLILTVSASYEPVNVLLQTNLTKNADNITLQNQCGIWSWNATAVNQQINCNISTYVQTNNSCNVAYNPVIQNNISFEPQTINNPITVNVPDNSEKCLNSSNQAVEKAMNTCTEMCSLNQKQVYNFLYTSLIFNVILAVAGMGIFWHDRRQHHKKGGNQNDGHNTTQSTHKPESKSGLDQFR